MSPECLHVHAGAGVCTEVPQVPVPLPSRLEGQCAAGNFEEGDACLGPRTRELADLDGMRVALQAEAAQALARSLVGQVEAPLQVLGGRLLHAQLLCILLVEEANFLPKRRRRWSMKVRLPLLASYYPIPKATYQPVVLPHFTPSLQGKSKVGVISGGGREPQLHLPTL